MKKQIFISSVQSEFSAERKLLSEYIRQEALFSRYFEPFLFEDLFKFMGFSTDGKSLTFNVGAAFGLGVNFSFNVSLYY